MEKLTLREIAAALGQSTTANGEITSVAYDSRLVTQGSLFVAFRGERVDGHRYIDAAFEAGAAAVISEQPQEHAAGTVFVVPDSIHALQSVAACYRARFGVRVIGVTGSVGKTTTKDMIASALEDSFRVMKTQGNRNNEIGAPMTMFDLCREDEVAVIEMGMSAPGEIDDLCRLARPSVGVITNIGVAHLEKLGSRENILKAKLELADNLPDGAPLFLCADNDLLAGVSRPRLKVVTYGIHADGCDISGEIISTDPLETKFVIKAGGESYTASIPGAGEHLVENSLAAFGIARELGVPAYKAIAALGRYSPSGMRQKVVHHGGITVVEDCYNASPDSMKAAIQTLGGFPCDGRRILIAADMLELGAASDSGHRSIGENAARFGVDILYTWGEEAEKAAEAARSAGMADVRHFNDKMQLCKSVCAEAHPGDILWFKASRGMQLEEVINYLYEHK